MFTLAIFNFLMYQYDGAGLNESEEYNLNYCLSLYEQDNLSALAARVREAKTIGEIVAISGKDLETFQKEFNVSYEDYYAWEDNRMTPYEKYMLAYLITHEAYCRPRV